MNFAELRQEVQDCGLDHVSSTRADRWINLAYRKLYQTELWPWRLTEASGASPLTVSLLGPIRFVHWVDGTEEREILPDDKDNLARKYDLDTTGDPEYWYVDDDGTIATYPVTTSTIYVRHYARAQDLSGTETPDIPTEHHYAIVAEAVRRGKLENGEVEAAKLYAEDYAYELAEMKRAVFNVHVQRPTPVHDIHEGYEGSW